MMAIKVIKAKKKGHGLAIVDDEMTIYEAKKQKTSLLKALEKYEHIDVDLSSVNEIDTAGVQLLIMIKHAAEGEGKTVNMKAHSPATLEAITLYNLDFLSSNVKKDT